MTSQEQIPMEQLETASEKLAEKAYDALDAGATPSEVAEVVNEALPEGVVTVAVDPATERRQLRHDVLMARSTALGTTSTPEQRRERIARAHAVLVARNIPLPEVD